MFALVREQLALENNCRSDDFLRTENIITLPVCPENRRKFHTAPFFLKMVTMGGNTIFSADEQIHSWLRKYVKDKDGHWLFEHTHLRAIDAALMPYGKQLFQTHHMYLPTTECPVILPVLPVKWFERADLQPLYDMDMWPNALGGSFDCMRPDMLAVAAVDKGEVVAVAGVSADTDMLWQVGIDVRPAYRGRGLGVYLVSLLRTEIEKRGRLPYYGTSLSNLASQKIALYCGFRPAWVETATIEW